MENMENNELQQQKEGENALEKETKKEMPQLTAEQRAQVMQAIEHADNVPAEVKTKMMEQLGLECESAETPNLNGSLCSGPSIISHYPAYHKDCITLCNVIVKKENTCAVIEYGEICPGSCTDLPIVSVDPYCDVYLMDHCCEVHEDSWISGVKTADVKATFRVAIGLTVEAPNGDTIPDLCTATVPVELPNVFTSCEIKNCRVTDFYDLFCVAFQVDGRIFFFFIGLLKTEACVMENEVKVIRCY